MKTINNIILFLAVVSGPLAANGQRTGSSKTPIVVGSDIAIVQTEYGKVRGYIHEGTYIYKGIPYAKAERFMPPAKPDTWEGVRGSIT